MVLIITSVILTLITMGVLGLDNELKFMFRKRMLLGYLVMLYQEISYESYFEEY